MKKIILFGVMLAILLVPSAFANEVCDYMGEQGLEVNLELPGALPYKNERLNFNYVNGSEIGHVITSKGLVTSFDCTNIEDPTFEVEINGKAVVEEILEAESPVDALDDAISKGDIKIKGSTFTKKVKNIFTRFGIKIASWFA